MSILKSLLSVLTAAGVGFLSAAAVADSWAPGEVRDLFGKVNVLPYSEDNALRKVNDDPWMYEECQIALSALREQGRFTRALLTSISGTAAHPHYIDGNGNERWATDAGWGGFRPLHYESYFSDLLGGKSLDQLARDRSVASKPFHVLDLFGSAVYSEHPELYTSLVGLRYAPLAPSELPPQYPAPNWSQVHGDAYRRKTWDSLDQTMANQRIPSFNLIIVRPVGPLHAQLQEVSFGSLQGGGSSRAFLGINHGLLGRAWMRLNKDGGIMLIELKFEIEKMAQFAPWLENLRRNGIVVQVQYNEATIGGRTERVATGLLLQATPSSPHILP